MAQNINRVTLTGNLTRDPELRQISGGSTSVCDLGIAVNGSRKDAQGNWVEEAHFFNVTVFGGQAEACAKFLAKGRPIAVDGKLRFSSWEDKNGGGKRSKVDIVAQTVQFLGGKPDGAGGQQADPGGFSDAPADTSDFGGTQPVDDDIPF